MKHFYSKNIYFFVFLVLVSAFFINCKMKPKVTVPDGKYVIDQQISENTSSSVQGFYIVINVNDGIGVISSIYVGSPEQKIVFNSDNTFTTPESTGVWYTKTNSLTKKIELRLKGFKYMNGSGNTTNPKLEYSFILK